MQQSEPEHRIDPEDGVARTLEELRELCEGKYSDAEVERYWEMRCLPAQEGAELHSVAADPFLTHTAAAERSHALANDPFLASSLPQGAGGGARDVESNDPFLSHGQPSARRSARPSAAAERVWATGGDAAGMTNTRRNPFLTAALAARGGLDAGDVRDDPFQVHGTADAIDVRQDPFLQRAPRTAPRTAPLAGAGKEAPPGPGAVKELKDLIAMVLGPGDVTRKPAARMILVITPWMVFTWVFFLWVVLQHSSVLACMFLTGVLAMAFSAMILVWHSGKRWGPVSFLSLGLLCLIATGAGTAAGLHGWRHYWRQFWWMHTGQGFAQTRAFTPAVSRLDAALLHFSQGGGDAVDHLRSAGYKDDHFYCVAPILSPETAGSQRSIVNYWAVGMDCCQQAGSFSCDDSRDHQAEQAVVMLKDGFPCPGCDHERFRRAVMKAEAVHGVVSAPGALYVRWVRTPETVSSELVQHGLEAVLLSGVGAYAAFWLLGGAVWYYGLGKRWNDAPLTLGKDENSEDTVTTVLDVEYDYGTTQRSDPATKPVV